MKTLFTLFLFTAFALRVSAQITMSFNFEDGQADTCWHEFANGGSGGDENHALDLMIAENPAKNSVNPSDSVLKFIARSDGSPWAGFYTDRVEPLIFTESAHTLTMLVNKPIISPSCMKVERSSDGGPNSEVKVPNTLIDEWELLTFDMTTGTPGNPVGFTYTRLTVFPDFPDSRTEETTHYVDKFSSPGADVAVRQINGIKTILYPNPAENLLFLQHPDMNGCTISNLLGKTVKTLKFDSVNSKFIEVSDLQTGVYFITVESRSGSYTSKFIKR